MFFKEIKAIKKAIKEGQQVVVEQVVGCGYLADAIYVNGNLVIIISDILFPFFQSESKKAKLDIKSFHKSGKGACLF